MKAETILSLYNLEYTFIKRPLSKESRYTDNLSKCISLEYQNEMSSVEMEVYFVEGISLAVSLLLESL